MNLDTACSKVIHPKSADVIRAQRLPVLIGESQESATEVIWPYLCPLLLLHVASHSPWRPLIITLFPCSRFLATCTGCPQCFQAHSETFWWHLHAFARYWLHGCRAKSLVFALI